MPFLSGNLLSNSSRSMASDSMQSFLVGRSDVDGPHSDPSSTLACCRHRCGIWGASPSQLHSRAFPPIVPPKPLWWPGNHPLRWWLNSLGGVAGLQFSTRPLPSWSRGNLRGPCDLHGTGQSTCWRWAMCTSRSPLGCVQWLHKPSCCLQGCIFYKWIMIVVINILSRNLLRGIPCQ